MKRILLVLITTSLFFLESCKDNDPSCTKTVSADALAKVDQLRLAADIATIEGYLASKSISAQTEPNGVRYVISNLGTGPTPCLESRIKVTYSGRLLFSGIPFDSSSTGVTFRLSDLVMGWQLVLPSIPSGSKVTLYIPSGYGYGTNIAAGGKIPSNSNLVFDIELLEVI